MIILWPMIIIGPLALILETHPQWSGPSGPADDPLGRGKRQAWKSQQDLDGRVWYNATHGKGSVHVNYLLASKVDRLLGGGCLRHLVDKKFERLNVHAAAGFDEPLRAVSAAPARAVDGIPAAEAAAAAAPAATASSVADDSVAEKGGGAIGGDGGGVWSRDRHGLE
eukprot:CAMPEP_0174706254 /NCGR_PEP_ID=MMETSP1094-20130205/9176_1 /TAXON_ID=156173 /ORGANISM="Chrysochromulina brevifilum, Strain UTEX LB 985" /LENGTH=166 /DNA_ID=CAMNT_0015904503 /DNA_START=123 /DNA_END=624 /DNA_ORIENTATION=+